MTPLGYAIHNLARRPARTLLTILAIALAVATAVALLALSRGIKDGVARGLDELGAEFIVQSSTAADILTARMPASMGERIGTIAGVQTVAGELLTPAVSDGHHVLVAGLGETAPTWKNIQLALGRLPAPGAKEILLGDVLAAAMDLSVGDTITIFDEDFTVVGITQYASALNRSLAVVGLTQLQEAALRPDQVSFFLVVLEPGLTAQEAQDVRNAIVADFPVTISQTDDAMAQDGNLAVLSAVSNAVSIIALSMGALSLFATQMNAVQERTREIGLLASLGWSDNRIVGLILLESLLLALAGSVLGVSLGIASSALFGAIPTIGSLVQFTVRANDLALPLMLALPICALGSAYPALRAIRLRPAKALRAP